MKYKTKYTDRQVSASTKIAHQICENKALKENYELTKNFWKNSKQWDGELRRQKTMAEKLIELYGEDVIIHMLQLPKAKYIISLWAEFSYSSLLKQAQDEVRIKKEKISKLDSTNIPTIISIEKPRPAFKKNGILGKLREIDG